MLFVEALGRPVAVFHNFPLATRQGRWRARWRNHCSFCAALSRERRGRLMARHRGRLPLLRRAALYVDRPFLPPGFAFLGEAKRRAIGPRGHAPGRRLVLAVGRSSRRRPGAGEASSPGSGRRIRSHPLDTCESALWRTALGIISYRIKVKCAPPMTGQARA
jgi:hypothetical protein